MFSYVSDRSRWRTSRSTGATKSMPPNFMAVLLSDAKMQSAWEKIPDKWVCRICKRPKMDTVYCNRDDKLLFRVTKPDTKQWTGISCICNSCGFVAKNLMIEVAGNLADYEGMDRLPSLWNFFGAQDVANVIFAVSAHQPHQIDFSAAEKVVDAMESRIRQAISRQRQDAFLASLKTADTEAKGGVVEIKSLALMAVALPVKPAMPPASPVCNQAKANDTRRRPQRAVVVNAPAQTISAKKSDVKANVKLKETDKAAVDMTAVVDAFIAGLPVTDICSKFDLQPTYLSNIIARSIVTAPATEYKRSGKPWLPSELENLLVLFDKGESITSLSIALERTPGAIASKLCSLDKVPDVFEGLKMEWHRSQVPSNPTQKISLSQ